MVLRCIATIYLAFSLTFMTLNWTIGAQEWYSEFMGSDSKPLSTLTWKSDSLTYSIAGIDLVSKLAISKGFSNTLKPTKIIPYYYRAWHEHERDDITVTTIVTSNRFEALARLVEQYKGLERSESHFWIYSYHSGPHFSRRSYICYSPHNVRPSLSPSVPRCITTHALHVLPTFSKMGRHSSRDRCAQPAVQHVAKRGTNVCADGVGNDVGCGFCSMHRPKRKVQGGFIKCRGERRRRGGWKSGKEWESFICCACIRIRCAGGRQRLESVPERQKGGLHFQFPIFSAH
jgi:hypothetical protein